MRQQSKTARDRIAQVEAHADRLGLTIAQLFKRANVAYTTWWRWTEHEHEPSLDTLAKLLAVRK